MKFLVSYGVASFDNEFIENALVECKSEEIRIDDCCNLTDGQRAQRILEYLKSRFAGIGNVVLYNFWEVG